MLKKNEPEPDALRDLAEELAAVKAREAKLREAAFQAEQVLRRYRTETPLGYQPHMIAHQADEALSGIRAALSGQQP